MTDMARSRSDECRDTRNGVAGYLIGKYGDKVVIELKWGRGAKI